MRLISLFTQKRFNSLGFIALFSALLMVFSISACGDSKSGDKASVQGADKGILAPVSEGQALPEGHPTMTDKKSFTQMPNRDHTKLKGTKSVKVSEAIRARYKSVSLQVVDNSKGTKDVIDVAIGVKKALADGFSLRVELFLPDYVISEDFIDSRTDEPNNPAIMLELYKGDKVIASGWVFEGMAQYNSYSHLRYAVVLLPTK